MKPPRFDYHAPESLAEALDLLADSGPDARILAGGQSLVPVLNFRLARPQVLIDINRIPELAGIEDRGDRLVIGAMTRQREIETSDSVARAVPLLHEATRYVAHLPIRTRGTVGGSIANADPAAEDPAVAAALEATMVCRSRRGERRIAAAGFFVDVLTTALEPDEMLVAVEFPGIPDGAGAAFAEISRRDGDFALAGVAAQITVSNGRVSDARIAACGVGPAPMRFRNAEEILLDSAGEPETMDAAADAVAASCDPHDDVHASAAYRRQLAAAMTRRALIGAHARAGGTA